MEGSSDEKESKSEMDWKSTTSITSDEKPDAPKPGNSLCTERVAQLELEFEFQHDAERDDETEVASINYTEIEYEAENAEEEELASVTPSSESYRAEGECDFARLPEPEAAPSESTNPDIALLPPDHPLMKRFQETLREHLLRTKEMLSSEIADMKYKHKKLEEEREERAVKLYDLQEEIKRQEEQVADFTKQIEESQERRRIEEEAIEKLKSEYESKAEMLKEQKTLYNRRMFELENIQALENNLSKWSDTVEDEVKNAARIVSRDAQLQRQISEEKRKADLLFFHLDSEVQKQEKEKQVVFEELTEMRQAIDVLNMSISNANADLEALQTEHKRLSQAWGEVIVAISHRDKILYQARELVGKEKEYMKLTRSSIEAIKKQIAKELEQNEKLQSFKTRLAMDLTNLKFECQKESEKMSKLEGRLNEIPLFMKETEKALNEAKREGHQIEGELRKINWQVDKESSEKYKLEESILKLAQERLINDKASEYRLKILKSSQDQRRLMEVSLASSQTQLSDILLELERNKEHLFKLREQNGRLLEEQTTTEEQSNHMLAELKNMENQIDIKMKRLDRLMRELDELQRTSESSGSPTERKMKQLAAANALIEQQIREYQQFWLMLQNHFVNLSQKRNIQLNEIQITRKQLSIIKQKSLKIDSDLEKTELTARELNREIQIYTKKIDLLSCKVTAKKQKHESEENDCETQHLALLEKLRENEMSVLKLESDIDEIQTEIENYKDLVLDKHREALSWETKYKLIEETLRWRKEEGSVEGEISAMKTEIHRMRIRHQQLQRCQEKLVQDLEHAVMHREQIFMSAITKQTVESYQRTKTNTTIQQKVVDLRNKLRQTQHEIANVSDIQLVRAKENHELIQADVKRLRSEVSNLIEANKRLSEEIEQSSFMKRQNLENIVRKQNRAKTYKALCCNPKSVRAPRSETTLQALQQKQHEILDNLNDLLQVLMTDFPDRKEYFERIEQYLKL